MCLLTVLTPKCVPLLFTYKPSYFFRNFDFNLANKVKGVWLIAESLFDFIFSHMSKPEEMSRKFQNRLVAKFPVIKHDKQERQIKTYCWSLNFYRIGGS